MSSSRVLAFMLPHKLTGSSLVSWLASSLGDLTYIFVLLFELCHHQSAVNSWVSEQRILLDRACIDGSACEINLACHLRFGLVCICVSGCFFVCVSGCFFVGEHSIDSDFMSHVCVWRVRTKLTQFWTSGCVSCVHVVVKLERMDIELGARQM